MIEETQGLRPRLVRWCSWFVVLFIPAFLLLFGVALGVDSDFFKRSHGPLVHLMGGLSAVWAVIVPGLAVTALVLNRNVRWRPAWWMNGAVLALWLLQWGAFLYFLFATPRY